MISTFSVVAIVPSLDVRTLENSAGRQRDYTDDPAVPSDAAPKSTTATTSRHLPISLSEKRTHSNRIRDHVNQSPQPGAPQERVPRNPQNLASPDDKPDAQRLRSSGSAS